jgi:hypothetical protein
MTRVGKESACDTILTRRHRKDKDHSPGLDDFSCPLRVLGDTMKRVSPSRILRGLNMRSLLLASFLLTLSTTHAAEPLKPAQLGKLQALIKPQADEEKFMQIPWMTSLWDARKQAAAAGKPILLWEMDGHPLSCV